MTKVLSYIAVVGAAALIAFLAGFTGPQIISIAVFVGFIAGTLFYWPFRLAFAFAGIGVLLASRLIDIPHLVEFASLDVILFLVGMMTIIGFLEERHFFEAVLEKLLPYVGGSARGLMAAIMGLAFLSAALVDEVTSILFMSAIVLRISRQYKLNPVPYIIMTVFATNIGSSATVVGNPIGVLIALRGGLSFPDFLRWATPIALAAWLLTVVLSFVYFRRPLAELEQSIRASRGQPDRETLTEAVGHPRGSLLFPSILFIGTVLGLVFHKQIEHAFNLQMNTMLVGVALVAASIVLFVERHHARELVERRVDWWTLAFFLLLFASAGTLRYNGVTDRIAAGMVHVTGGAITPLLLVITWSIGALTAFMDNVLAVASFIPIVGDLAKEGIHTAPLWWGMLFGGTILGNLTLIGSTANIVALGLLERNEKRHVTFMEWFWPGLVTAVPSLALATVLLWLQLPLLTR